MGSGPSRRPSTVLAVVLLVALATGAAASLLIGSATAPSAPPARASEIILTEGQFLDLLFAFLIGLAAFGVYRRFSVPSTGVPGRVFVTFLVAILVAVLVLVAVEVVDGGHLSLLGAGPAGPGGNSTSPGSMPPNLTTNLSHVSSGASPLLPGLPGWVPFAIVAGIVLVVALVAAPVVRGYAADRRAAGVPRARTRAGADVVEAVLRQAERELERGDDAREVIVRLYADLLGRLGRIVGSVDPETPEEIRSLHLERLGIRPEAATVLTRLFEKARYSTHPLGSDASERARTAVRQALADLDRTPEAA
jgi:hypothetical protein